MPEVFGNFTDAGVSQEFLIISFSPHSLAIQDRWRNNSLSADFLADYWGTFFPVQNKSSQAGRTEVRDAVGFIANELLENAVKFNHQPSAYPIAIALYLSDSDLRFYVTNSIDPRSVKNFQRLIRDLLTGDPDEMYIRQLENNAVDENNDSCMGFLTMLNDYNACLAWKFETVQQDPEIVVVTTMARLAIMRNQS